MSLTSKQYMVIDMLIDDSVEAGRLTSHYGISRRRLTGWLRDAEFMTALSLYRSLHDFREQQLRRAARVSAVYELITLMKAEPGETARKAAVDIFKLCSARQDEHLEALLFPKCPDAPEEVTPGFTEPQQSRLLAALAGDDST